MFKESNNRWYLTTTAIIFTVMAIAHLAIILYPAQAALYGIEVPLWINGVFVVLSGYLATRGFMVAHKL